MRGSKRERRPGVWELRVHLGGHQYRSATVHGDERYACEVLVGMVDAVAPPDGAPSGRQFGGPSGVPSVS